MRHTRGHTGNRRSHHALKSTGVVLCSDCGQPKAKHRACAACGKYKGNDILAKRAKADKKEATTKAKKSTRS